MHASKLPKFITAINESLSDLWTIRIEKKIKNLNYVIEKNIKYI
jgi:hypothetical protein